MREFSAGSEQLNALCTITPHIGNGKDHPLRLRSKRMGSPQHVTSLWDSCQMLLLPPAILRIVSAIVSAKQR
jgi:hypothetical protein